MSSTSRSVSDCPVCECKNTYFYINKGEYSVTRCPECTFMFVDPLPPPEIMEKAGYKFRKENISGDFFPKASTRARRAMVTAFFLQRYIRNKDVVDIACGGGFVVEAMRKFGGRAMGIDLNADRIAYAKKHFPQNRFICGSYEELLNQDMQFDFVYSSQLLEHLPDNNNFMNVLSQITRPGGMVYIKTPDREHWLDRVKISDPRVPGPPIRKCYFNRKSLSTLMERHGFTIRKVYLKFKSSLHILVQNTAT